jgi:Dienelactone hydrolase and related enzymes
MKKYLHNKKDSAVIILHEIYGVNAHIEQVCESYYHMGYDVYCPNLYSREFPFAYTEMEEAYQHFVSTVGFDAYTIVNNEIQNIRDQYKRIILIGYSVGATIAWRCSQFANCDGVIGFYGSRIRDYMDQPCQIPTLLIFAIEDTFDVSKVVDAIEDKKNVSAFLLDGKHGFLDTYSANYNKQSYEKVQQLVENFLSNINI